MCELLENYYNCSITLIIMVYQTNFSLRHSTLEMLPIPPMSGTAFTDRV